MNKGPPNDSHLLMAQLAVETIDFALQLAQETTPENVVERLKQRLMATAKRLASDGRYAAHEFVTLGTTALFKAQGIRGLEEARTYWESQLPPEPLMD